MNSFNRKERFGGGDDRRGGGFGGGFGGKRELELFPATCASCGKPCQVPFRPNGKKPVYCKECFAANGGPAASGPSPRRDFGPASAPRREERFERPQSTDGDKALVEVKREIQNLGAKIDRLVTAINTLGEKASATAAAASSEAPAKKAKKAAAKKK
jgi:CxxC-x17-CxxC domain-containing protein